MSFGAPGGSQWVTISPPDLGSFPLDRQGTCRDTMIKYMECLQKNKNDGHKCRLESKAYIQCRMDNNLMAQDDLKNLGFWEEEKSGKMEK